ncbi:hypothetical protein EU404_20325 [Salmonella enterica subsp. enterica serovar Weltevreden]|nr:hypothetical protein [Salmonella enterica subsp. enterica serovar Weltevreden]
MSIDRSITGRSGYSDEENAIIDAYIGLDSYSKQTIHNLKQHLARRDGDIRMLKDRLRRAVDKVKELRTTIEHMNIDFDRMTSRPVQEDDKTSSDKREPSGGWVENPGCKACPVFGDCVVEVEFRSGLVARGVARNYRGEIDNNNWDIVKYRIIK